MPYPISNRDPDDCKHAIEWLQAVSGPYVSPCLSCLSYTAAHPLPTIRS